jgi:hypothetical protein
LIIVPATPGYFFQTGRNSLSLEQPAALPKTPWCGLPAVGNWPKRWSRPSFQVARAVSGHKICLFFKHGHPPFMQILKNEDGSMFNKTIKKFDWFFKRFREKKEPPDLLELAGIMGPLIDKLVMDLFLAHSRKLMTEPITYIVAAVWGATKGGVLDATQQEMHRLVLPCVNKIFELLDLKGINEAQSFAIGFLIRGYIISKVTYMIESFRNQVAGLKINEKPDEFMMNVKPMGTA